MDDNKTITAERLLKTLNEYAAGKTAVDAKATENQEWWRLRHWTQEQAKSGKKSKAKPATEVGSGWAVNSILNKHADIMDSFPKPNILPREKESEEEANMLSSIVPAILEQCDYEKIYRQMGWDISIDGTAITGVFWDTSKRNGMGDIAINNIDVHNLFWQPGVSDIQDSKFLFHVNLVDAEEAKTMWPDFAREIQPHDSGLVKQYAHDDNIDTSKCVEVVNVYYKRLVSKPVYIDGVGEGGKPTKEHVIDIPQEILHLAIIVGNKMVFCSEGNEDYKEGFYKHGKYPFVIRRLFPIKDSPWGFGYLDIMKNPQRDIDKLDQAIIKNAQMRATPRWWGKASAGIDKNKFADWSVPIVEVTAGELGDAVKPITVEAIPTTAQTHLVNKIDELKETSGNRDFSQGTTAGGVTAASAIAALQEAGSKLSRDINKELYRGFREECYLIIELIRQFYTEDRTFRVKDAQNGYSFRTYNNAGLQVGEGSDEPVFDIVVTAEKASPFSRAAQNETAKELYSLGMFAPENAIPALVCLEMMDFEGKDKVIEMINNNAIMIQQFNAAMQLITQVSQMIPEVGQQAAMMGLIDPAMMQAQQAPSGTVDNNGTAEERAARKQSGATDGSQAAKARTKAANVSNPY